MAKAMKTNLKRIHNDAIYRDGSGAPDEAFIELTLEGNRYYILSKELYSAMANPDKKAVLEIYELVRNDGRYSLIEKKAMTPRETEDFKERLFHKRNFGI